MSSSAEVIPTLPPPEEKAALKAVGPGEGAPLEIVRHDPELCLFWGVMPYVQINTRVSEA